MNFICAITPAANCNPNMILKFDSCTVNAIKVVKIDNQHEAGQRTLMIAACSDGYLKILNFITFQFEKALPSVYGAPTCFTINEDMMPVGYEDDSIIIYNPVKDFLPMFKLEGHKSFVTQVLIDPLVDKADLPPATDDHDSEEDKTRKITTDNEDASSSIPGLCPNVAEVH